ncbi:50S ribosomal protein L5 [candidate division WWE3 bacterium RIFOXYC1_FULL_39_7]|uniref:Large ribosomal subunit protein uL5 n=2 Tax=Katanobacteria TaxID=422282 RepID=A0A1F4X4J8_UNCKA|nr:MAG: 50S ribosomal protein L5 [candidate division WWE3 bacterium RIFOXYC1_FULL_39_7]OGC76481.1 MAG: 50S ribosomal protein L5 [candidate division WWE3 bacterium RIFOXYD1_FULL_39_9]
MNRLREKYIKKIVPKLIEVFKFSNVMEVPQIQKVNVNVGIGNFRENREAVESFVTDLANITSQKPYARTARLSIAGFKIRQGETVGYAVTLRGENMWAFLDKLLNVALPRVRDFRGLSDTSFDENGNYSFGIKEHVIFPEVNQNSTKGIRSLQVTVVMSGKNIEANKFLLKEIGVPFKKEEN